MPSVENFYWVLYHNLLKPHGLDCWYYYPWGTKKHLSRAQYQPWIRFCDSNHVLFHYDQEPIWQPDLGHQYESTQYTWSSRLIKILANSERSALKKQLCKDRYMLDWYFFYHGFAALDWFRDTKFIADTTDIETPFLSLNHLVTGPRAYRLDLVSLLLERGIANRGVVSLHTNRSQIEAELANEHSYLSYQSKKRIIHTMLGRQDLPWLVDQNTVDSTSSARCGQQEYALWQKSLFQIVNETVFYASKLHLTEKIFKPIVASRAFILVGAPGNLAYLRSYGFRTFDAWIDESYDSIEDPEKRLDAIASEIKKLSMLSSKQIQNLYRDMQHVLAYNKQHFFTNFRQLIVNELVDNFEQCLRVWNNQRIDDRAVKITDLTKVKKLLLT